MVLILRLVNIAKYKNMSAYVGEVVVQCHTFMSDKLFLLTIKGEKFV